MLSAPELRSAIGPWEAVCVVAPTIFKAVRSAQYHTTLCARVCARVCMRHALVIGHQSGESAKLTHCAKAVLSNQPHEALCTFLNTNLVPTVCISHLGDNSSFAIYTCFGRLLQLTTYRLRPDMAILLYFGSYWRFNRLFC